MTAREVGSRALAVDDSRATRRILGRMLVETGFEVTDAENGKEALATLTAADDAMKPFTAAVVREKLALLGIGEPV